MCSHCIGVLDPNCKVVCECKHTVCFKCVKVLLKDCDMLPDSGKILSPPVCGVKKLGCLAKYKPGTDEAVKPPPGKRGCQRKGDAVAAGSSQSVNHDSPSQAQCCQQHKSQSLTQQLEQEDEEDGMDEEERNGSRDVYWSLVEPVQVWLVDVPVSSLQTP
eukprot:1432110-Rhodomonas_salina.1